MKKKILAIALGAVLLLACAVGVSAAASPQVRDLLSLDKFIKSNQNPNSPVVAVVNGEKIRQNDIDNTMAAEKLNAELSSINLESQKSSLSSEIYEELKSKIRVETEEEVLTGLIRSKVLAQETKKQGITVTDEEAAAQIADTNRQITDAIANGTDAEKANASEVWNNYLEFIQGQGMTQKKYESTVLLDTTKKMMAQTKLYQKFAAALPEVQKKSAQEVSDLWEQHIGDLVKQADVQRLQ